MAQFTCLLDAAIKLDFDKIAGLLRSGIDINCRNSFNRTVLHYLAGNAGRGELVHFAISVLVVLGANINAREIIGLTPLHHVLLPQYAKIAKEDFKSSNGWTHKTEEELDEMIDKMQIATLRHLVKLGADVNAKWNIGVTSLTRAIHSGNLQGAETLIKLGVNVNSELITNFSLLHSALSCDNKELIKCLLELEVDMESKASFVSPLHIALKTQKLNMIKALIQNGADVNLFRQDNVTPIMRAVYMKSKEMIDTLAQLGADINRKISSTSVIHEMLKLNETDILQTLFKAVRSNIFSINLCVGQFILTALGKAVERSDCKMAEILLKNGADVNVRYDYTCPPLFTAMRLGHVDMITELVRLGADVSDKPLENTTALMRAVETKCPKMLDLLLAHGGDVNLSYNINQTPIHDAMSRGDTTQVKTLVNLGADINYCRKEGIDLLHRALDLFGFSVHEQNSLEIHNVIKMLIQAGINLNNGKTYGVTLLHDAVKLGDIEMVHTLARLGVNINKGKSKGINPLCIATRKGMNEVIRYLIRMGANINQSFSTAVTPLHDAVKLGNVDLLFTLIDCGAAKTSKRLETTALNIAISNYNNNTVKCLLQCGADVNQNFRKLLSPLHDAIENSDLRMIDTLVSLGVDGKWTMSPPLIYSIMSGCYNITETLLMFGANPTNFSDGYNFYPLRAACMLGLIDLVRLLILEGADVDKCDYKGKKPLEYLPFVNHVDYHVIKDLLTSSEVLFEPRKKTISVSECKNMKHLLCTPGIGDVKNIPTPQSSEISSRVYKVLDTVTTSCRGHVQLKAIGSAAEGTKVGLPTEMDFMIEIQMKKDVEEKTIDKGNGYIKYEYVLTKVMGTHRYVSEHAGFASFDDYLEGYGSAAFHNDIMEPIFKAFSTGQSDEKLSISLQKIDINENDRKACSQTSVRWNDGNSTFNISVDLVPCLHVKNWPEGAITKTWLMNNAELRSHGYVLVPKPPHVKSDLAKECTELELQTLWKISFPHLETKHMQHLEQRVKDVYTTAKCLRNPDVSRILIRDNGSLPRPVDKYITSYLLKMCFFENVEYFLDNELSLEAMVCKVYQDLVVRLSEGFVPIFFLPKVNALGGGKLDPHKCVQAARIMARFVRGLYLRDSDRDLDTTICDEDEEITVYQQKPTSVYKVQDI